MVTVLTEAPVMAGGTGVPRAPPRGPITTCHGGRLWPRARAASWPPPSPLPAQFELRRPRPPPPWRHPVASNPERWGTCPMRRS